MIKALMFLSKGFEDLEAGTFIDVLGWTKRRENLIPIELKTSAFHDEVTGRFGIHIKVDYNIRTVKITYSEFDNNIISCAGPASSLQVAYKLVELLSGKENMEGVKKNDDRQFLKILF